MRDIIYSIHSPVYNLSKRFFFGSYSLYVGKNITFKELVAARRGRKAIVEVS